MKYVLETTMSVPPTYIHVCYTWMYCDNNECSSYIHVCYTWMYCDDLSLTLP